MVDGGNNRLQRAAASLVSGLRRLRAIGRSRTWQAIGVVVLISTAFAWPAQAVPDFVWQAVGGIAELLTDALGQLTLLIFEALLWVSSYNGFVTAPAVANGWVIVRDVVNMFFILVLLVMAFGTILGVDNYSYKNRALIKLIIMAVVINFSRTITGLMIDFGQVIMLTFVNGYSQAAGGNLIEMLKLREQVELRASTPGAEDPALKAPDIAIQMIMGLIMIAVTLAVMVVMLASLVVRIIYLWLLTVLSPLTFFLKAVPGGQASGYYAEWWKMLTQNIITGPVLAFFLWLSLVTVQQGSITEGFREKGIERTRTGTGGALLRSFESDHFQQYIIAIGLLLGGLMMAQRIGGAGVGFGKSLVASGQKYATSAGKWVGRKAGAKVYRASGAEGVVGTAGAYLASRKKASDTAMEATIARRTARVQTGMGKVQAGIGKYADPRALFKEKADKAVMESKKLEMQAKANRNQAGLMTPKIEEAKLDADTEPDSELAAKKKTKYEQMEAAQTALYATATQEDKDSGIKLKEAEVARKREKAARIAYGAAGVVAAAASPFVPGLATIAAGALTVPKGIGTAGAADTKLAQSYQAEQVGKDREKLKSMRNDEVAGLHALGEDDGSTKEQQMARIMEIMSRPNMDGYNGKVDDMEVRMKELGAGKQVMRDFNAANNVRNVTQSKDMTKEEIARYIDSGQVDVTKLAPDSIRDMAGALATSLSASRYAKAVKDDPLKEQAFVQGMQDVMPGFLSTNSPQLLVLRQMLMKMDKTNPLKSAYQSTAKGTFLSPAERKQFIAGIKSDRDGHEQIMNPGAGMTDGRGAITDVGRATANGVAISMLVQSMSTEQARTTAGDATLRAIYKEIKSQGSKKGALPEEKLRYEQAKRSRLKIFESDIDTGATPVPPAEATPASTRPAESSPAASTPVPSAEPPSGTVITPVPDSSVDYDPSSATSTMAPARSPRPARTSPPSGAATVSAPPVEPTPPASPTPAPVADDDDDDDEPTS